MCWSEGASITLAVTGIATTGYLIYKKETPVLWLTVGYFSLMEILQALTYPVLNNCSSPTNQVLTILGYLHIAFQPFFINAISMYFIPKRIRRKISIPIYILCFFTAIIIILQLYPFSWAGTCAIGKHYLCGTKLCSISGNLHLAWEVPLNNIGLPLGTIFYYGSLYMIVSFLVPFLYGSWKFTIYHFLMGPLIAKILTNNINETAAIWCLLSISFLLIILITKLKKSLFVNNWPLWPKNPNQRSQT